MHLYYYTVTMVMDRTQQFLANKTDYTLTLFNAMDLQQAAYHPYVCSLLSYATQ